MKRIETPAFSEANINNAQNQIPLDKPHNGLKPSLLQDNIITLNYYSTAFQLAQHYSQPL